MDLDISNAELKNTLILERKWDCERKCNQIENGVDQAKPNWAQDDRLEWSPDVHGEKFDVVGYSTNHP